MARGDEEGDETEVYTLTSETGLEYDSTETLSDMIFQMHNLAGKRGKISAENLTMLRQILEDAWSLVSVLGDRLAVNDPLDVHHDDLPAGWSFEGQDDDDESE